ncbi:hypothetical protein EVAR_65985_1, partial [Eumeta japonica]
MFEIVVRVVTRRGDAGRGGRVCRPSNPRPPQHARAGAGVLGHRSISVAENLTFRFKSVCVLPFLVLRPSPTREIGIIPVIPLGLGVFMGDDDELLYAVKVAGCQTSLAQRGAGACKRWPDVRRSTGQLVKFNSISKIDQS